MRVTSSKPLSLLDVKEIFEKQEKDGQLSYEQQQTLDNAKKFTENDDCKKNNSLAKKLEENKKLDHETIIKIIDIKPRKPNTLKSILLLSKIELSDEEIAEVLKIING